jgi:hypothetical protein
MLLAVVLDLLESITSIIWYTFLCKKNPTIAFYAAIPYLIFKDMFLHDLRVGSKEIVVYIYPKIKKCEIYAGLSVHFFETTIIID